MAEKECGIEFKFQYDNTLRDIMNLVVLENFKNLNSNMIIL